MRRIVCNSRPGRLRRSGRPFLLLLMFLAAACNTATEPRYPDDPDPETLHSIAYLKTLCAGKSSVTVTRDIVIRGFIVGNDLYGEFYKTIVVEDATGGISIAADLEPLAADYPWGSVLTVRCNGLSLYDYGGKILLGTTPGENGVGRIPREELPRYLSVAPPDGEEMPRATVLALTEVSQQHIDTRVRFDGVRFETSGTWCDLDPETGRSVTTERTIIDAAGNRFTVRTAGTCLYAREPVPSGTGSLYGVIDYFAGKYTLHVTNREAVFSAGVSAAAPPTACP